MTIRDQKVSIALDNQISNVGNLTYRVFEKIINFLGFSEAVYVNKQKLIDESLVSQRNTVAHGEYLTLDEKSFRGLSDEVIVLMRAFKTDIENAVITKSYIKC